jgi:hypothetical protein
MDQNSPDNIFSLLYYLNREQYGDRPLLYGQYYNAPATGERLRAARHIYRKTGSMSCKGNLSVQYDDRFKTIFPRMYYSDPEYIEAYKEWGR